nr:uncharacterized protein LOC109163410 [Ipomoea trifida]
MHVEETLPPPPIAKHGAWMIVNRKTKGPSKRPEKARGKTTGEVKAKSTRTTNDHKVTQAAGRTGGASGAVRAAGNSAQQVHTVTNLSGKGNQIDVIPVSNTFSYLQDLESLPEAPVLLEEETAPRSAPKTKNQRRNNKGKKQPTPAPESTLGRAGIRSEGGPATNQLFVFGNPNRTNMGMDGLTGDATGLESECSKSMASGIPTSRRCMDFNEALLAKLAWQMNTCEDKLWVRIMKEKYVKAGNFFTASTPLQSSWGWRSILRGRSTIELGAAWRLGTGDSLNFWSDWWVGDKPLGLQNSVSIPDELAFAKVSHFILPNRSWDFDRLQAILPREEVNKIRSIPIPLDDLVPDALYWPTSPGGMFSVREAYRYIVGGDSSDDVDWVWKVKTAERCRMFLWLAVKNKLLTNAVRARRQLTDEDGCTACGEYCESIDHILMHCDVARTCWRKSHTPTSFTLGVASPFIDWLKINCSSTEMMDGVPWSLTFTYTCWELWKARNKRIFEHVNPSPQEIIRRADFTARETFISGHQRKPERMENMRWIFWTRPNQGWVKINTDGAYKKGTDLASAGGLARDHLGDWLYGFITKIGSTYSFAAELWGLREGLRLAKTKGFRRVVLEMDSESVVALLNGDLEDHGCYSTLVKDCRFLLDSFEQRTLQHILREGNKCADHLANMGQLGEWGTVILDSPPASIEVLLAADAAGASSLRVW